MLPDLGRGLLDLFFPCYCCACGLKIASGIFCAGCRSRIIPLSAAVPPHLFGAARYEGALVTAIHRFKYAREAFLSPHLAVFLVETCGRNRLHERVDCIVPVPLHPVRFRERGFNQAELLGRELSHSFSLPLLGRSLVRGQNTPSQTGLSAPQRAANVSGAFRVRRPGEFQGRRCLLVDDVLTTGATMNACRSRLLAAGAEEVLGLALAKD